MTNYYYLISSLPELDFTQGLRLADLDEALDLIDRQVSDSDLIEAIRFYYQRNEVLNLIEALQHQHYKYEHRPPRLPYRLDYTKLIKEKRMDELPDFISEWFNQKQSEIALMGASTLAKNLLTLLYNQPVNHPYNKLFLDFESLIRRQFATLNKGSYKFINQDLSFIEGELGKRLEQDNIRLSSVDKLSFPYLEELILSQRSRDLKQMTNTIHRLLWNKSEALSTGHYFDDWNLLSYVSRAFLTYRREQLEVNEGQPQLDIILQNALSS